MPPGEVTTMAHDGVTTDSIHAMCSEVADDTDFSGVVRVDLADESTVMVVRGFADRSWDVPLIADTRLSVASATKGFTALVTLGYVLGFWLAQSGPMVSLEGHDADVSFGSWHDPTTAQSHTVIRNTSEGAWPMLCRLAAVLGPD